MKWGNRGPGSPIKRRPWSFRPSAEGLEGRQLLTTFDLTSTQSNPYGIETIGARSNNFAGTTVTDVGNVDGSGFDSFVVYSPASAGGGTDTAYLVLGSKRANVTAPVDFRNLTSGSNGQSQRASDLATLGQTNQVNPTADPNITPIPGFDYDGIAFTTSTVPNSSLGFSVAALGDINNDGADDFAIGAPNDRGNAADGANANGTGSGRVYIIYGGTNLSAQGHPLAVDLEPTVGTLNLTTPTRVVSLSLNGSTTSTNLGYSVAGLGNYFNDTTSSVPHDIAIGAPGFNNSTGEVFAITRDFVNAAPNGGNGNTNYNINLGTLSPTTGTGGIIYQGFHIGGRLGAAVSSAGSFDDAAATLTSGTTPLHSLLIGEPNFNGGSAYLVYGAQSVAANKALGQTYSLLNLGNAATTALPTPLEGVVLNSTGIFDQFGASVTTAGDFNGDGVDDIAIGAPGAGNVDVIYGIQGGTNVDPLNPTTTRLNGQFAFDTATGFNGTSGPQRTDAVSTQFTDGVLSFAGTSLALSGHVTTANSNANGTATLVDLLIGAPGSNAAYLVPGSTAIARGTNSVPTGGTPNPAAPIALGTIDLAPTNGSIFTASSNSNSGTTVASNTTDPAVSILGSFGTSVSARNPIVDPNTLLTTLDSDTIPDLFFGVPSASLLDPTTPSNTNTGTRAILRANAGIAYAVEGTFLGTGTTTGSGQSSTSIGATFNPVAAGLLTPPNFTGENAGLPFPPISTLEHFSSYAPLPVQVAYEQFLPAPGFRAREAVYHNPKEGKAHQAARGTELNVAAIHGSADRSLRVHTLPTKVFTRGKFKHGQTIKVDHKVKVIPRSQQHTKLTSA